MAAKSLSLQGSTNPLVIHSVGTSNKTGDILITESDARSIVAHNSQTEILKLKTIAYVYENGNAANLNDLNKLVNSVTIENRLVKQNFLQFDCQGIRFRQEKYSKGRINEPGFVQELSFNIENIDPFLIGLGIEARYTSLIFYTKNYSQTIIKPWSGTNIKDYEHARSPYFYLRANNVIEVNMLLEYFQRLHATCRLSLSTHSKTE